jgi:hypothetical protein
MCFEVPSLIKYMLKILCRVPRMSRIRQVK